MLVKTKKTMRRIEMHLTEDETIKLDAIADKQGRSRKNFCETEIRKIIYEADVKIAIEKLNPKNS